MSASGTYLWYAPDSSSYEVLNTLYIQIFTIQEVEAESIPHMLSALKSDTDLDFGVLHHQYPLGWNELLYPQDFVSRFKFSSSYYSQRKEHHWQQLKYDLAWKLQKLGCHQIQNSDLSRIMIQPPPRQTLFWITSWDRPTIVDPVSIQETFNNHLNRQVASLGTIIVRLRAKTDSQAQAQDQAQAQAQIENKLHSYPKVKFESCSWHSYMELPFDLACRLESEDVMDLIQTKTSTEVQTQTEVQTPTKIQTQTEVHDSSPTWNDLTRQTSYQLLRAILDAIDELNRNKGSEEQLEPPPVVCVSQDNQHCYIDRRKTKLSLVVHDDRVKIYGDCDDSDDELGPMDWSFAQDGVHVPPELKLRGSYHPVTPRIIEVAVQAYIQTGWF